MDIKTNAIRFKHVDLSVSYYSACIPVCIKKMSKYFFYGKDNLKSKIKEYEQTIVLSIFIQCFFFFMSHYTEYQCFI